MSCRSPPTKTQYGESLSTGDPPFPPTTSTMDVGPWLDKKQLQSPGMTNEAFLRCRVSGTVLFAVCLFLEDEDRL